MQDFSLWLSTGFSHVCDLSAYDHILFIILISIPYSLKDWKELLIRITAFTIGHSITLALGAFRLINISSDLVELLIVVTILFSAILLIVQREKDKNSDKLNFGLVLFFGCIHGLGFSQFLKSMFGPDESLLLPLFSFNIGIEIAQLLVLFCIQIFCLFLTSIFRVKTKDLNFFTGSAIFGIAILLFFERLNHLFLK